LDGDDLAEIGLGPSDTCKKGLPRVRFPRKAPPTLKSGTKDEQISGKQSRRESDSRKVPKKLQRENFLLLLSEAIAGVFIAFGICTQGHIGLLLIAG